MAEAKSAAPKKNPRSHKRYEIKGEVLTRKNKSCPKCGKGFLLANHKDRLSCGRCHYTEFTGKKEVKK
jgi:small subunit ribosomal protein S27Ae